MQAQTTSFKMHGAKLLLMVSFFMVIMLIKLNYCANKLFIVNFHIRHFAMSLRQMPLHFLHLANEVTLILSQLYMIHILCVTPNSLLSVLT